MKRLRITFEIDNVPVSERKIRKCAVIILCVLIVTLTTLTVAGINLYKIQNSVPRVYITYTGKKYHNSDCYYLNNGKKEISLKWAEIKGYKPCSKCKPSRFIK